MSLQSSWSGKIKLLKLEHRSRTCSHLESVWGSPASTWKTRMLIELSLLKKKKYGSKPIISPAYIYFLLLENSASKSTNRLRLASLALLRMSRKKIDESRYVAFIEARLLFEGKAWRTILMLGYFIKLKLKWFFSLVVHVSVSSLVFLKFAYKL